MCPCSQDYCHGLERRGVGRVATQRDRWRHEQRAASDREENGREREYTDGRDGDDDQRHSRRASRSESRGVNRRDERTEGEGGGQRGGLSEDKRTQLLQRMPPTVQRMRRQYLQPKIRRGFSTAAVCQKHLLDHCKAEFTVNDYGQQGCNLNCQPGAMQMLHRLGCNRV